MLKKTQTKKYGRQFMVADSKPYGVWKLTTGGNKENEKQ